ncbi:hypothetical protein [Kitasatospora sp. KL5]|uniref:hypothetical protein n=1 Tax=Kitasatospora sp. KL5 TaxID=3425125 RepID=UPI003D6F8DBC
MPDTGDTATIIVGPGPRHARTPGAQYPGNGYCLLGTINDISEPQLVVEVFCFAPAGGLADSSFAAAYIRKP